MLSHIRVLDLTDRGAGLCGQMLADLGADVRLLEPPGGAASRRLGPFADDVAHPDASLVFWSVHRGKRSEALDAASADGRARLHALLAEADVLIEDFTPSARSAAGLEPGAVAERAPHLVHVSITPFGADGPKADWAATDLTVTASSMALHLTGDHDRPPLTATVPQAFLNAGAEAAVATMVALAERERSGRGQHVDVSAQTAMMMTTQSVVLAEGWNDQPLKRFAGGLRLGPIHLRFVYPCRDGHVNFTFLFGDAIGPATARFFAWMHEEGACSAEVRDLDWIGYAAMVLKGEVTAAQHTAIQDMIEAFTRRHTKAELLAAAFERRVLVVPLSDASDLAASDQLAAREFWVDIAHPDRAESVRYPGPFVKLSETPLVVEEPPPPRPSGPARWRSDAWAAPQARSGADAEDGQGEAGAPLAGLKVLDFSWVYAGPAVTRVLGDHGATVVRVESSTAVDALRNGTPFKDGEAGYERSANYGNVNLNKLSLGLNLRTPEGRDVARKLAEWADVVVENYTPRMMKRWGLDYARLRERNPRLVMLSSCLSGQTGPEAALAGYGTMGAALAGFGFLTGWPDRPPAAPFLAYTDYVSPRFATAALLAALDHRRRTGQGQHIDCSQSESAMHLLAEPLLEYHVNGRVRAGAGNACAHWAPSGVYPVAGDDRWIAIAAPDDETFGALAGLAGRGWSHDPRFAGPEARLAHRGALDDAIAEWTATHDDAATLEAALQHAHVPAHRVATSADCFADPQLAHRGHFVTLDHPVVGPVPFEHARFRLSRTPAPTPRVVPTLGQDNHEVLAGLLGLDDDAIAALAIAGAIE